MDTEPSCYTYRCRRCGECFEESMEGAPQDVLAAMPTLGVTKHRCRDFAGWGSAVADLIAVSDWRRKTVAEIAAELPKPEPWP
jgi:hypothetical protein